MKRTYKNKPLQAVRILFVCHGNICRSPMAEFVLKDMAERAGLPLVIASAATSSEDLGAPVYPQARAELARHGLSCAGKTARQLTRRDYDDWDSIIGMDAWNLRNMQRLFGGDPEGKLRLLLSFAGSDASIDDPWYTGRFEEVYAQIERGCRGLIEALSAGRRPND